MNLSDPFSYLEGSTDLLQDSINLVPILQLQHFGGLVVLDTISVQEETEGGLGDAFPLGVRLEHLAIRAAEQK